MWFDIHSQQGLGNTTQQKRQTRRQATWLMQQPVKIYRKLQQKLLWVSSQLITPFLWSFYTWSSGVGPYRHIYTKWHSTSGQLTKPGWALFPRQVKLVFHPGKLGLRPRNCPKARIVFWEERLSTKNCFRTIFSHSVPKEGKRASLLWEKNEADILKEAGLRQESRLSPFL